MAVPQPPKKLRKTASTASNWGRNFFLRLPLNSWRNSDLFEKKKFFCSSKNTKVSLSQTFMPAPPPLKKPTFFLEKNHCDKLTLVFLELQKNFFFSNRSEFRQEFRELIRKTFRPQLEAVEAVFRNFLGGWGGTFFNFFYFFSYLWYEHISISASWRHCHYFFFQKNWIFGHILFFLKIFC